MFTYENLEFHYSVSAPVGGGTSELKLITGYPDDVNVKTYIINDDKLNGISESLSVYETGLVVYSRATPGTAENRTNKEFIMQEDGTFKLSE